MEVHAPEGFHFEYWRPSFGRFVPPGMRCVAAAWAALHYFGGFRSRDYCVLFLKQGDRIVHRSCAVPGYFRWPFMSSNDLQVSSTWTDPEFRGRGLAQLALKYMLFTLAAPGRRFWYVCRAVNEPSMCVCHNAGFELTGYASRSSYYGVRLLRSLRLQPLGSMQSSENS